MPCDWPINFKCPRVHRKALCTRIPVSLSPQLFLSVFEFTRPHVSNKYKRIHSSTQDSSGNIDKSACVKVAIFTVKNWALSCYVTGLKKYPDLASTRFRIHSVFKRIKKVADFPSKRAKENIKLHFVSYQTWKSHKLPNDLGGSTWQPEFLKNLRLGSRYEAILWVNWRHRKEISLTNTDTIT